MGSIESVLPRAEQSFPYFAVTFRHSNKLLLLHVSKETETIIQDSIKKWREDGLKYRHSKRAAKEYELKGSPLSDLYYHEKKGVAVKFMLCHLLTDLSKAGWQLSMSCDQSIESNGSTWIFERTNKKREDPIVCISLVEPNRVQILNANKEARAAIEESLSEIMEEQRIKKNQCDLTLIGTPWTPTFTLSSLGHEDRVLERKETVAARNAILQIVQALDSSGYKFYGSAGSKDNGDALFFQKIEGQPEDNTFSMLSFLERGKIRLVNADSLTCDSIKEFCVKQWDEGIDRFKVYQKDNYTEIKLAGSPWLSDQGPPLINKLLHKLHILGLVTHCAINIPGPMAQKSVIILRKSKEAQVLGTTQKYACITPCVEDRLRFSAESKSMIELMANTVDHHWPSVESQGWATETETLDNPIYEMR